VPRFFDCLLPSVGHAELLQPSADVSFIHFAERFKNGADGFVIVAASGE
jgi:hypothetical protein